MKILLVKLQYLYIRYAWISIKKKQNSNQNGKVGKMAVLVKTFDHCHHKFQLFQLPNNMVKELETIYTNIMAICTVVWKALYNFNVKRAQEARHKFEISYLDYKYLFGQIWSKKLKLSVEAEIWYQKTNLNMQNSMTMLTSSVFDWK